MHSIYLCIQDVSVYTQISIRLELDVMFVHRYLLRNRSKANAAGNGLMEISDVCLYSVNQICYPPVILDWWYF